MRCVVPYQLLSAKASATSRAALAQELSEYRTLVAAVADTMRNNMIVHAHWVALDHRHPAEFHAGEVNKAALACFFPSEASATGRVTVAQMNCTHGTFVSANADAAPNDVVRAHRAAPYNC
jgi:hypothetical protein